MESADVERLRCLLRERALQKGDFRLRSGVRSSVYLDARLVTLSPDGLALCAHLLLASLPADIAAVGGPTLGADPLVAGCCLLSGQMGRPLMGFIVRTAPKEYGQGRLIEGPVQAGLRVAVVEDTVTTGGALRAAIRASEEAGLVVGAVRALVDREAGGVQTLAQEGYDVRAVLTMSALVRPD